MRILVVEDDPVLGDGLSRSLRHAGYAVDTAQDGKLADDLLSVHSFDLVVLDLGLPGLDGLEVLRRLRRRPSSAPVLILTARDEVEDRVAGLDLGADDYMVKPFSIRELLARVRALLRRAQPGRSALPDELRFGDVVIDFRSYEATRSGKPLDLTRKEFGVLRFLGSRAGEVVARDELLNEVWGYENYPTTRTVDNHIASLRAKIEADPAAPRYLRTVHGVGYKFVTNTLQEPGRDADGA